MIPGALPRAEMSNPVGVAGAWMVCPFRTWANDPNGVEEHSPAQRAGATGLEKTENDIKTQYVQEIR